MQSDCSETSRGDATLIFTATILYRSVRVSFLSLGNPISWYCVLLNLPAIGDFKATRRELRIEEAIICSRTLARYTCRNSGVTLKLI